MNGWEYAGMCVLVNEYRMVRRVSVRCSGNKTRRNLIKCSEAKELNFVHSGFSQPPQPCGDRSGKDTRV
jgi:hypothetical protein